MIRTGQNDGSEAENPDKFTVMKYLPLDIWLPFWPICHVERVPGVGLGRTASICRFQKSPRKVKSEVWVKSYGQSKISVQNGICAYFLYFQSVFLYF